jgi:hypothetical protein
MADQQTPAPTPAPGGNQPSKITPEAIQTAIAVLTAAAQQPAPPPVDEIVAKEKQKAIEVASKVEALDAEIKVLQGKKKDQCLVLLPLLHKHFGGRITLANGADVFAKIDAQKRPTKKGMVSYCVEKLKDQGEAFAKGLWASFKGKPREYVSVSRAGEPQVDDETGEPVEGPTEE